MINFYRSMLRFDIYRVPFRLMLPDGEYNYRTLIGSSFSICTIIGLTIFFMLKAAAVASYSNYSILVSEILNFFEETDAFGEGNKFQIAAGITEFNGIPDDITDETIG